MLVYIYRYLAETLLQTCRYRFRIPSQLFKSSYLRGTTFAAQAGASTAKQGADKSGGTVRRFRRRVVQFLPMLTTTAAAACRTVRADGKFASGQLGQAGRRRRRYFSCVIAERTTILLVAAADFVLIAVAEVKLEEMVIVVAVVILIAVSICTI